MLCVSEGSVEDEREDSPVESRGLKRKISLTRCDACENEEAKYRCPNCLRFSCSLSCVKQHKLQSGCSGVRNKTAFVALSKFSEINLLNDYRYLEETTRVADKPNRDTVLHTPPHFSYSMRLLKKNATAAKVNLKFLPRSFTKRKENTSIYKKTEKKLYWHLKLHFPQSNAEYTERVPEDRVLEQILSDYIHPTESDPVKSQRLKLYALTSPDQMCVFLKSEQRRPGFPKYHELNMKKSLRENLMYKTIVEYPELCIVLKDHHQEYLTKFPERKSSVPSSSTKESSSTRKVSHPALSRNDPVVAECPKHIVKKRKNIADESELEEGEIISDEEEEGDEDEKPVCSANDKNSMDTDHSLPHDEKDVDDDADDGCNGEQGGTVDHQSAALETNEPSHGLVEEHETIVHASNNQNVTMETDHSLPHDDDDDDDGCNDEQGGTVDDQSAALETNEPYSHGLVGENVTVVHASNNQDVTMETDHRFPHDEKEVDYYDGQGGTADNLTLKTNGPSVPDDKCEEKNEDQVEDVDQNVTMETNHLPPSQDKDIANDGDDDGGTAQGQNITIETVDSPSSHDQSEENDDAQVEVSYCSDDVNDQMVTESSRGHCLENEDQVDRLENVTIKAECHSSSPFKNIDDGDDIHQGAMESNDPPPPHDQGEEDKGQVDCIDSPAAVNIQKVPMEAEYIPSFSHDGDGLHEHSTATSPSISMKTTEPSPHNHGKEDQHGQVVGDTDSAVAVSEENVIEMDHSLSHDKGGDCLPPSSHDQDI